MNYEQKLSQELFGRRVRLPIAAWILEHGDNAFFQAQIAEGVGTSPQVVMQELQRLLRMRMVRRLPPRPGQRQRYLMKTRSQAWSIVERATEVARADA